MKLTRGTAEPLLKLLLVGLGAWEDATGLPLGEAAWRAEIHWKRPWEVLLYSLLTASWGNFGTHLNDIYISTAEIHWRRDPLGVLQASLALQEREHCKALGNQEEPSLPQPDPPAPSTGNG
jgi:hypothetical protein